MTTTENITLKKDFLNIKKPKKNKIKHLNYYSFEDRTFDVAKMFINSIDKEYTNIIKANTYKNVANGYDSEELRAFHPIYKGVYKLAPIDTYIGNIPLNNQKEIDDKFKLLINNPFLKQEFELVILAPLNNFAIENNIKAIDPIVFAYFEDNNNNYLITLSQWI